MPGSFISHVAFLSHLLEDGFHQKKGIKPRRVRHGIQKMELTTEEKYREFPE